MQLKPEEISKVIRSQIKYYDNAIKQNETGTVLIIAVFFSFEIILISSLLLMVSHAGIPVGT